MRTVIGLVSTTFFALQSLPLQLGAELFALYIVLLEISTKQAHPWESLPTF
jgi:hypothetical protein